MICFARLFNKVIPWKLKCTHCLVGHPYSGLPPPPTSWERPNFANFPAFPSWGYWSRFWKRGKVVSRKVRASSSSSYPEPYISPLFWEGSNLTGILSEATVVFLCFDYNMDGAETAREKWNKQMHIRESHERTIQERHKWKVWWDNLKWKLHVFIKRQFLKPNTYWKQRNRKEILTR